jgi:hypothetical protein
MRNPISSPICLLAFALCGPTIALGDNVALGTDYLAVLPGTQVNLAPFGMIDFKGNPIGPGDTSISYHRLTDALIGGGPVPILLTAVSLESVSPVLFNSSFFDLFVTIDPTKLETDTGTIDISGSLSGGSFTTQMTVSVIGRAVKVGDPTVTQNLPRQVVLNNPGANWVTNPPPGTVLVPGPDNGSQADLQANLHSGLDSNEVDFFPSGPYGFDFTGSGGGVGELEVTAATPEPATMGLVGLTLAGLTLLRRRKS